MITSTLTKYFGTGPRYKEFFDGDYSCAKTWWYNLLFVNNLFQNVEDVGSAVRNIMFYN